LTRADWQKLAEERVKDAKVLLDGGQWAAGYVNGVLPWIRIHW
jgi:hypothetical protein